MKYFEKIGNLAVGTCFILNGKKYQRKNTPVGNGCTTGLNYLAIDAKGNTSIIEKVIPVVACS